MRTESAVLETASIAEQTLNDGGQLDKNIFNWSCMLRRLLFSVEFPFRQINKLYSAPVRSIVDESKNRFGTSVF